MKVLNFFSISVYQIKSFVFLLLYLLGGLNLYFSDKNNYCVMTYMFEYPQFVRISFPENDLYPQYGLYAYSEGRLTERARRMWFDGVPVLFLPGNSGSHMQGRSLASVALRMAEMEEYHFDFYMVSYNEDLSGLYGGVLQSETEFAAACIAKILSLYKPNKYTRQVPTSVILIGHSMGGVIAKRLLAYPNTMDVAHIAITLAAPLAAPVLNTDVAMNDHYRLIDMEWQYYVRSNRQMKDKKVLISLGNGPRDLLVPSALTSSEDSDINALTTSIPGVWTSPDHVSIVWCKQLVMVASRFLFDIVDRRTQQVVDSKRVIVGKARQYFQANRSMTLSPTIKHAEVPMTADGFWYEDNRRIYQISRPEVVKVTYLMVRLVKYPQNRFAAVATVGAGGGAWLYGCAANDVHGTHRYCKTAEPLGELTRWSGAAEGAGRRSVAAVRLSDVAAARPHWTHVVVKVAPSRKPVTLNVDINDYESRRLTVDLPHVLSPSLTVIQSTEAGSVYYELWLPGLQSAHQAYLLYVEARGCEGPHHATAELHVPWAGGHEYYHYFTHLKRSPMKLRLLQSSPNSTAGAARVTLWLDPQCTYTVSVSPSWYHTLAQLTRHYTPLLVPYIAAVFLLAAGTNVSRLARRGACVGVHAALAGHAARPHLVLGAAACVAAGVGALPLLPVLSAAGAGAEPALAARSLLALPAYLAAGGAAGAAAAAALAALVCGSQLAHRLLFRLVWRGGAGAAAERVAGGLRRLPLLVAAALLCCAAASGAAALAAGAAYYAFVISKMYEEYLEDYVYKLMAKVAAQFCRLFVSKKRRNESQENANTDLKTDVKSIKDEEIKSIESVPVEKAVVSNEKDDSEKDATSSETKLIPKEPETEETKLLPHETEGEVQVVDTKEEPEVKLKSKRRRKSDDELDEELNNLHFHTTMFFLWLVVTLLNVPALLTWARNFKYSMVLQPDTSYHTGLVMSVCSAYVWQIEGPRKNLRHYETLSALIYTMAVFIVALGPMSLAIVNYGITAVFALITAQQMFDKEDSVSSAVTVEENNDKSTPECSTAEEESPEVLCSEDKDDANTEEATSSGSKEQSDEEEKKKKVEQDHVPDTPGDCDVCSESSIYKVFKNLREKFSFDDDL